MALNITSLSERWGDIFGGINETNSFAGTTVANRADNIADEYTGITNQRDVIENLTDNALNVISDLSDWNTYLNSLAVGTLQAMCRDDSARPVTDTLSGWFDKLNRDMSGGSNTFNRPTVTATVTLPGTNIGDGYLIASVVDPVDGISRYYAYAEVIRFECTGDSFSGSATAGSETFTAWGETSVPKSAYNWPKGSGAQTSYTAINVDTDDMLTDGGLEAWGGTGNNTPTSWSLHGTAGTHITRGSSSPYDGNYYCIFTGDGSTTVGIYQAITDVVQSDTNYAIQFWVKLPSGTLSTGSPTSLRVALTDGSGTVLNDNASSAQSSSITASTLNGYTSWTRVGVVLRTPRNLPTVTRLEFKFITNALDNAKAVYLDQVDMVEMTEFYPGGPYFAVIAGATEFALRDKFTATIANDKGVTNFVRCLDRVFELADNNIRLQTAASFTVNDNLIT